MSTDGDMLMRHTLAEWMASGDIKVHGHAAAPSIATTTELTGPSGTTTCPASSLQLECTSRNYAKNRVGTLNDFKGHIDMTDARVWWARMKLRYSCSSVTVTFVRVIVPELEKRGITHAVFGDCSVKLSALKIVAVFSRLSHRHVLHFPRVGHETVEGYLETVSHNVLVAPTGEVVDLTGGQFTGAIAPVSYPSFEVYTRAYPGEITHVRDCEESEIAEQLQRDAALSRHTSPVASPRVWGMKVVLAVHAASKKQGPPPKAAFCMACFGTPSLQSPHALRHCARCKTVAYCSLECQRVDWNRHKCECVV